MERVLGLGGIFFRAQDPKALKAWYVKHLGVGPASPANPYDPWEQEAGPTAFEPFPANTEYFGRESQQWMLNFRVREAAVRFFGSDGHFDAGVAELRDDPEGNPIELWQPL